jgi:hypothetical protein
MWQQGAFAPEGGANNYAGIGNPPDVIKIKTEAPDT